MIEIKKLTNYIIGKRETKVVNVMKQQYDCLSRSRDSNICFCLRLFYIFSQLYLFLKLVVYELKWNRRAEIKEPKNG